MISVPEFMLDKNWPSQQYMVDRSFHEMLVFNITGVDPFAIKYCTKNGSTTIRKIHYNLYKPSHYTSDYNKYTQLVTEGVLEIIKFPAADKSLPLYCFYRDPIERFISASNFSIKYIKNRQADWLKPNNINDMIQFIFEYKIYQETSPYGWDIFWPQTLFLGEKENYAETYNIKYINDFFKLRNINVNELGSEKTNSPKIFCKEQISTENLNILKNIYSIDYEWDWY